MRIRIIFKKELKIIQNDYNRNVFIYNVNTERLNNILLILALLIS